MSTEYFPFKIGDKLKSSNAYKNGDRRTFRGPLGEQRKTDIYMEVTGIGRTLFFATWDCNEHVHAKCGQYEMWDGLDEGKVIDGEYYFNSLPTEEQTKLREKFNEEMISDNESDWYEFFDSLLT